MNLRKSIWWTPILVLMLGLTLNGTVTANVAATTPVSPDNTFPSPRYAVGSDEGSLVRDAVSEPPAARRDPDTHAQVKNALDRLPLHFIDNQGHHDAKVAYYAQGGSASLYFTADDLLIALPDAVLRQCFLHADPEAHPVGADEQQAKFNHFSGDTGTADHTDMASYGKVTYRDLYPGVDLTYTGQNGILQYAFVVHPGAHTDAIRLAYAGADELRLAQNRDLLIMLDGAGSPLRNAAPTAHQEIAGERLTVPAAFTLYDDGAYGFAVDNYDPNYPLAIETQLRYSTFMGGSRRDEVEAIALDGAGNVYVAGRTWSSDFPTTDGAHDQTHNGESDAFVSVLDPTLSTLRYSTFLGGSSWDRPYAIAVTGDDRVYVAGTTWSSDFPTTDRAYNETHNGEYDVFVSLLDPTLGALRYSTLLGGTKREAAHAIAVDKAGNVYVTGFTDSSKFPTSPEAYTKQRHGEYAAFLTTFDSTLTTLRHSTYLGGSGREQASALTIDGADNIYVTGWTTSNDFPTTTHAFSETHNGQAAFVSVLDPALSTLRYSTFLGGSGGTGGDHVHAIALDSVGNVYVTGGTWSDEFPTTPGAYDRTHTGLQDPFVSVLDPTLSTLRYSTLLGAPYGSSASVAIALDSIGHVHVAGQTSSEYFPITPAAYNDTYTGHGDAFVTVLDPTLSTLRYSTYLGGSARDVVTALTLTGTGSIYAAGITQSDDFPTTDGAYDETYNGQDGDAPYDVFVTTLAPVRYTISGEVRDPVGSPIANVTVSAGPASTTTDVHGNYTLALLPGTYEIRPSKVSYAFTPASISLEVDRDREGVSFRGENIACAVPLSEPFLQFPLSQYRSESMESTIAATNSWFDHDTPKYTPNDNIQLYTAEVYSGSPGIEVWGGLYCWGNKSSEGENSSHYCYDGHNGYDYPGVNGVTTIYAAAEGTVVAVCSAGSSECDQAHPCGPYGKQVWVDHGNNYATHYAHLHTVHVSATVGTTVTADTPIGTTGCTGNSRGPHLHFATYFNWNLRDPWITSVTSARSDEVVDPFGWDGLEKTPPVSDPWDTPSFYLWQQPLHDARPIDPSGGQLASPSGRVLVDIPPSALSEATVMSLRPGPVSASLNPLRSTASGFWLRALWDLNRGDSTLQTQSETPDLAKPITVTMNYADAELTRLDTTQLVIHRWNEGAKTWQPLSTTLDPLARTATALTDNLGAFDLQAPLICRAAVLEPNDSHATASYLTPNEPIRTLFDIPDDEDWFRFAATEGMTYTLETADLATGVATILEVYDTNAVTLLAQDGADGSASGLVWTAPGSRSFYIRVRPAPSSVTGCDAHYTLTATPQPQQLSPIGGATHPNPLTATPNFCMGLVLTGLTILLAAAGLAINSPKGETDPARHNNQR